MNKAMSWASKAGRGLFVIGAGYSIYNIAAAQNTSQVIAQETRGRVGSLAGGYAGAKAGAVFDAVAGPLGSVIGSIIGAAIGGLVGGGVGHNAGNIVYERFL